MIILGKSLEFGSIGGIAGHVAKWNGVVTRLIDQSVYPSTGKTMTITLHDLEFFE